jgi:hypothetical protein
MEIVQGQRRLVKLFADLLFHSFFSLLVPKRAYLHLILNMGLSFAHNSTQFSIMFLKWREVIMRNCAKKLVLLAAVGLFLLR